MSVRARNLGSRERAAVELESILVKHFRIRGHIRFKSVAGDRVIVCVGAKIARRFRMLWWETAKAPGMPKEN